MPRRHRTRLHLGDDRRLVAAAEGQHCADAHAISGGAPGGRVGRRGGRRRRLCGGRAERALRPQEAARFGARDRGRCPRHLGGQRASRAGEERHRFRRPAAVAAATSVPLVLHGAAAFHPPRADFWPTGIACENSTSEPNSARLLAPACESRWPTSLQASTASNCSGRRSRLFAPPRAT